MVKNKYKMDGRFTNKKGVVDDRWIAQSRALRQHPAGGMLGWGCLMKAVGGCLMGDEVIDLWDILINPLPPPGGGGNSVGSIFLVHLAVYWDLCDALGFGGLSPDVYQDHTIA